MMTATLPTECRLGLQIRAGLEGKESSLLMLPSMVDVLPAGCDMTALIPRPCAEHQGCIMHIRGQ